MNDNKNEIEFKWYRGFKMTNIKNKFIENSIGIAILICSGGSMIALLIKVIAPYGLILGI